MSLAVLSGSFFISCYTTPNIDLHRLPCYLSRMITVATQSNRLTVGGGTLASLWRRVVAR